MGGQPPQIVRVARRNDGAPQQVGGGDEEGVDGELRTGADASEQLTGPDAGAGVHRVNLHPFPAEPAEDGGVPRMASHDLGEHGRHGAHREVPLAHRGRQSPHSVFLEQQVGVPIHLLGVGSGRDQYVQLPA